MAKDKQDSWCFYPSRAALKLKGAMNRLGIQLDDTICLDLGAGAGGFTTILLEYGAERVYSFEIGYGLLDYLLRNNPRVIVQEKIDFRSISSTHFSPEDWQKIKGRCSFVTADLSFISTARTLEFLGFFIEKHQLEMHILLLVKPQFNASAQTDKGILSDPTLWQTIIQKTHKIALELNFQIEEVFISALKGRKGNQETFFYISKNKRVSNRDRLMPRRTN